MTNSETEKLASAVGEVVVGPEPFAKRAGMNALSVIHAAGYVLIPLGVGSEPLVGAAYDALALAERNGDPKLVAAGEVYRAILKASPIQPEEGE